MPDPTTAPTSEYEEILALASEEEADAPPEEDDSPWPDEPARAAAPSRPRREEMASVYDRSDAAPEGRETLFTRWDVDSEERKIRGGRVGVAAVVGLVAVFGLLGAVQGRSGVAADTATSPTASPEATRRTPVVGQELRRPPARFDTSSLSAVEDEPEAPPPPPADYDPEMLPEPVQVAAAPRATAPNSWRTSLQIPVPEEVGDDREPDRRGSHDVPPAPQRRIDVDDLIAIGRTALQIAPHDVIECSVPPYEREFAIDIWRPNP